jgi:hypothetical protein
MIVPPLWVFSGLSIITNNSFDWSEYAEAITEAKEAEKYDQYFSGIYGDYYELLNKINSPKPSNSVLSNYQDLSGRTNDLSIDKVNDINKQAMSQIALKITDVSGLADVAKIKSGLKQILQGHASLTTEEPNYKEPSLEDFISKDELIESLFPAKNLENFKQNIEGVELKLADIIQKNQVIAASNESNILKTNEANLAKYKKYQNELLFENARFSIIDSGSYNLMHDLSYDFSFPEKEKFSKGLLNKDAVIELTITSKNLRNILPMSYLNRGLDLEVALDKKRLSVSNLTNKYITIDAVSLYHQQDVLTKGGTAFQNYVELAPGTITNLSLNEFDLSSLKSDYLGLTKKMAAKTDVKFGFAVKYRITGEDVPKTLYNKNSYNLYKLL